MGLFLGLAFKSHMAADVVTAEQMPVISNLL